MCARTQALPPQRRIFLLIAFSKGERSDLSQAERNSLAALTKVLVSEYKRSKKIHDPQGPR